MLRVYYCNEQKNIRVLSDRNHSKCCGNCESGLELLDIEYTEYIKLSLAERHAFREQVMRELEK